jgi:hypothetical protein
MIPLGLVPLFMDVVPQTQRKRRIQLPRQSQGPLVRRPIHKVVTTTVITHQGDLTTVTVTEPEPIPEPIPEPELTSLEDEYDIIDI